MINLARDIWMVFIEYTIDLSILPLTYKKNLERRALCAKKSHLLVLLTKSSLIENKRG